MPVDPRSCPPRGVRPPISPDGRALAGLRVSLVLVAALAAFQTGCVRPAGTESLAATAHVVSGAAGEQAAGRGDCFDLGEMDDPDHLFRAACASRRSLTVKAKAYVSRGRRSKAGFPRGAWGDTLGPGVKAIAVSPDLVDAGLGYKTRLTIEGLPGEYVVLDLMHGRWRKTIDVYFGDDGAAARQWGNRTITISWE